MQTLLATIVAAIGHVVPSMSDLRRRDLAVRDGINGHLPGHKRLAGSVRWARGRAWHSRVGETGTMVPLRFSITLELATRPLAYLR